jgi:hypothetical protein
MWLYIHVPANVCSEPAPTAVSVIAGEADNITSLEIARRYAACVGL